jgi:hypothetical protein
MQAATLGPTPGRVQRASSPQEVPFHAVKQVIFHLHQAWPAVL